MGNVHFVFGDAHAHPDFNNDRADWLGQLIYDVRPDVVIDIGDTADMPSLSTYDKNKRNFVGRSYERDINAHNEFQDRVWHKFKINKRKFPRRVRLIGNHEQRIDRALDLHPELQGTLSYGDLDLTSYYDDIVHYNGQTPGTIEIDGVTYSHYFTSGVLGRPVSGEHEAYTLLAKKFTSVTQGHSHKFDYCLRRTQKETTIHGLITGCYQDYNADWAGEVNKLWWRGCFVKRDVDNGSYNLEQISLESLRKAYSG